MVIEGEREFFIAIFTLVDSSVSVVSSDVSDADVVDSIIKVRSVAVNVDDSGLAGFHSVDWEVVALVRAGDVVVEVAEKWKLTGLVVVVIRYFCAIEHGLVVIIQVYVVAEFFSNEVDDVVQLMVAQCWETSPVVDVAVKIRHSWESEGRSNGQHLEVVLWKRISWEFQSALMADHLVNTGDKLAAAKRSIAISGPAVETIRVLGGMGQSDESGGDLHFKTKN